MLRGIAERCNRAMDGTVAICMDDLMVLVDRT
jgi:hypothetical protein